MRVGRFLCGREPQAGGKREIELLDRDRRVSVVRDAIGTLKTEDGERTLAELQALGARFVTTNEALAKLDH